MERFKLGVRPYRERIEQRVPARKSEQTDTYSRDPAKIWNAYKLRRRPSVGHRALVERLTMQPRVVEVDDDVASRGR